MNAIVKRCIERAGEGSPPRLLPEEAPEILQLLSSEEETRKYDGDVFYYIGRIGGMGCAISSVVYSPKKRKWQAISLLLSHGTYFCDISIPLPLQYPEEFKLAIGMFLKDADPEEVFFVLEMAMIGCTYNEEMVLAIITVYSILQGKSSTPSPRSAECLMVAIRNCVSRNLPETRRNKMRVVEYFLFQGCRCCLLEDLKLALELREWEIAEMLIRVYFPEDAREVYAHYEDIRKKPGMRYYSTPEMCMYLNCDSWYLGDILYEMLGCVAGSEKHTYTVTSSGGSGDSFEDENIRPPHFRDLVFEVLTRSFEDVEELKTYTKRLAPRKPSDEVSPPDETLLERCILLKLRREAELIASLGGKLYV